MTRVIFSYAEAILQVPTRLMARPQKSLISPLLSRQHRAPGFACVPPLRHFSYIFIIYYATHRLSLFEYRASNRCQFPCAEPHYYRLSVAARAMPSVF